MRFGRTGQYHHAVEAVNKFENGLRLKKPPTAVGGSFSPAYTIRSTAILEYPQRQLGDGSDPTSDTNDSGLNFWFFQWRMPPLKDFIENVGRLILCSPLPASVCRCSFRIIVFHRSEEHTSELQ